MGCEFWKFPAWRKTLTRVHSGKKKSKTNWENSFLFIRVQVKCENKMFLCCKVWKWQLFKFSIWCRDWCENKYFTFVLKNCETDLQLYFKTVVSVCIDVFVRVHLTHDGCNEFQFPKKTQWEQILLTFVFVTMDLLSRNKWHLDLGESQQGWRKAVLWCQRHRIDDGRRDLRSLLRFTWKVLTSKKCQYQTGMTSSFTGTSQFPCRKRLLGVCVCTCILCAVIPLLFAARHSERKLSLWCRLTLSAENEKVPLATKYCETCSPKKGGFFGEDQFYFRKKDLWQDHKQKFNTYFAPVFLGFFARKTFRQEENNCRQALVNSMSNMFLFSKFDLWSEKPRSTHRKLDLRFARIARRTAQPSAYWVRFCSTRILSRTPVHSSLHRNSPALSFYPVSSVGPWVLLPPHSIRTVSDSNSSQFCATVLECLQNPCQFLLVQCSLSLGWNSNWGDCQCCISRNTEGRSNSHLKVKKLHSWLNISVSIDSDFLQKRRHTITKFRRVSLCLNLLY